MFVFARSKTKSGQTGGLCFFFPFPAHAGILSGLLIVNYVDLSVPPPLPNVPTGLTPPSTSLPLQLCLTLDVPKPW